MKHTRWIGIPTAAVLAAAGVFSVAAAPLAPAATAMTPRSVAHVNAISGTTSSNWSGYADIQSGAYTYVAANWTEPSYKCNGHSPESGAIWAGLDGYFQTSPTVEQGGTIEICSGTTQTAHWAWWEMYPGSLFEVFKVNVGDKMFASVTYGTGSTPYAIVVKDLTSGKSLNKLEACPTTCNRSSAEWIVETPFFTPGGIAYLPRFKAIKFTAGLASQAPNGASPVSIASFTHVSITLTNGAGTTNRAVPSALTSNGQGFSVKWLSSAP